MIDFLKRLYESAYDLPSFYIGIEGELQCHIFTIFFLLALFLSFLLLIRMAVGSRQTRREKRRRKRNMEKNVLKVLEEKDKNKKNL